MMADRDITKVNAFFQNWKGAIALFNKFTSSHNRFVIELKQPDSGEYIGISFSFCNYIAGPTWWDNCELKCFPWKSPDGKNGYEVRDEIAGFLIRGTDSVVIGEENLSTASVAYVN
jgi:hypothetical protein